MTAFLVVVLHSRAQGGFIAVSTFLGLSLGSALWWGSVRRLRDGHMHGAHTGLEPAPETGQLTKTGSEPAFLGFVS